MSPRTTAIVAFLLVWPFGFAYAQETGSGPAVRELPGIGAAGSLGFLGTAATVRASLPVNDRWGFDLTVGHVRGHGGATSSGLGGYSISAQARWLWHGRGADGHSGYWLAGPQLQEGTNRTVIVWPDRPQTVLTERIANATLQVGYGWDWLRTSGTRFGWELSAGGNERGPTTCVNAFVVWGPPRR